jgi:abortive infection bacteriophage resistance protein
MAVYQKPYLTISQQIDLVKQRGLIITDEDKASEHLLRIGYYRLSGYWHVFRQRSGATLREEFLDDVYFSDVVDLYVFDKRLRLLMLDAIERIEVALRVAVALQMGKYEPRAHLNETLINPRKLEKYSLLKAEWEKQEQRAREDFVQAFQAKYPKCSMPIWMAIEVWDFGALSKYISLLNGGDINAIAQKFGIDVGSAFPSIIRSIGYVRNVSAHHGRLWNRSLTAQPRHVKSANSLLQPVLNDRDAMEHVFGAMCYIQYFMRKICPNSTWSSRVASHMSTFPANKHISPKMMGVVEGWQGWELWRKDSQSKS